MKKGLLVFLFLLTITMFASCGNQVDTFYDEVETGDITITLQPYYRLDANTKTIIHRYESEHKNVHFEILPDIEWGQMDIAMAKTFSDIASGGGPDIIMMTNSELPDFVEKRCLRNLSDVISEDSREALIDSVLEYGKINDSLFLLPQNTNITSMVVNKKYCSSQALTISEALEIIDKREEEGNPFEYLFVSNGSVANSFSTFMRCIDESNFIDREKGNCSFDSELFIKLLKTCKKYDDYSRMSTPDSDEIKSNELLKEDKILGQCQSTYSLISYSTLRASLGDSYIDVGVPSDCGNGKKISFASAIGVNKNTTHFIAISEFLDFMYSYDARSNLMGDELRTDIYKDRISYNSDLHMYGIEYNDGDFVKLAVKEDGTPFIDDYFEFLNSFSIANKHGDSDIIKEIIYEDTAPFFEGEKTAEEVAKLVQTRISLYLKEKN